MQSKILEHLSEKTIHTIIRLVWLNKERTQKPCPLFVRIVEYNWKIPEMVPSRISIYLNE